MGDFAKTKEYRALKKSLTDNLEARGLTAPIYADMVRRYLRLCVDEREADRELEEKGMDISYGSFTRFARFCSKLLLRMVSRIVRANSSVCL